MDARAVIEVLVALFALAGLVALWLQARTTARKVYVLASQIKSLLPLEAEVAAQNAIIAAQRDAIEKLQAKVARLETEVATWKWKFDTLIVWVRPRVPEAEFDKFLAQLEAGPVGG